MARDSQILPHRLRKCSFTHSPERRAYTYTYTYKIFHDPLCRRLYQTAYVGYHWRGACKESPARYESPSRRCRRLPHDAYTHTHTHTETINNEITRGETSKRASDNAREGSSSSRRRRQEFRVRLLYAVAAVFS